jgi:transposase-like protein
MTDMICKRCQATDYVKNGIVRGLQRYRCHACGCNFTATKPRGKPAAVKALGIVTKTQSLTQKTTIARVV